MTTNTKETPLRNSHRRWFGAVGTLLSALLIAAVLSSCSPAIPGLVGKWKEKDDPNITEFRDDGTFSISGGDQLTGKYKSAGGGYITMTIDGDAGKVLGETKWKVVVQGDVLELTDPDGKADKFERVK